VEGNETDPRSVWTYFGGSGGFGSIGLGGGAGTGFSGTTTPGR
jgi:hypothetical protein